MLEKNMNILSIQFGAIKAIPANGSDEWWDKEWNTAFAKSPRPGKHWLAYRGFENDQQADSRNHGGVDKAVCVYASEHYPHWRDILKLPDFPFGAFGENFTTQGLIETEVCVGDILSIGEAIVQVSQPRQPCWKLARHWRIKDLASQVEQNGFSGFYLRVLRHGHVISGDSFELRQRLHPRWTIQNCNEIMYHRKEDAEAARELSGCPELSGSWKDALWKRATTSGVTTAP